MINAVLDWGMRMEEHVDRLAEQNALNGCAPNASGHLAECAIVIDRTDNVLDLQAVLQALPVLQQQFPELTGMIYIAPASILLRGVFTIITPILNRKTKDAILILKDCAALQQYVAAEQLPARMGGTDDWCFDPKRDLDNPLS